MEGNMKIFVVAPHPDDEILGCGGTIARFVKEKHDVYVAILTKAGPPLFTEEMVQCGRNQALASHHFLGVKETVFCDLPAAALDRVPHAEINQVLGSLVDKINPEMMFIPFGSDIHLDHQHTFLSSLVAARPNRFVYPKKIYAYETLSETNWNAPYLTSAFQPNAFIDISDYLDIKLKAFAIYEDQVKEFPHERSLETIKALATLRGSTVHRKAAEAFVVIREVL
jgi:LmbE family N-acetylglucosaminyl deacetylase